MPNLAPLAELIARHESKGDYDIVYLGIPERWRPEAHLGKRLTECSVDEVLGWQAFVTSNQVGAVSSAAGKWQVIRKTLETFGPVAGLKGDDIFSPANQDRIFETLLDRRGLGAYLAAEISDFEFANNLAQEWAALPVVETLQGAHRTVNRGETFYAGDSVNTALATAEEVLAAIRAIPGDSSALA